MRDTIPATLTPDGYDRHDLRTENLRVGIDGDGVVIRYEASKYPISALTVVNMKPTEALHVAELLKSAADSLRKGGAR
jgi:hypothetical protein